MAGALGDGQDVDGDDRLGLQHPVADERRRGRLLPGLLADLVVLSRDPFTCPPDELESIEVVSTMVGGKWVYQPPPWD